MAELANKYLAKARARQPKPTAGDDGNHGNESKKSESTSQSWFNSIQNVHKHPAKWHHYLLNRSIEIWLGVSIQIPFTWSPHLISDVKYVQLAIAQFASFNSSGNSDPSAVCVPRSNGKDAVLEQPQGPWEI